VIRTCYVTFETAKVSFSLSGMQGQRFTLQPVYELYSVAQQIRVYADLNSFRVLSNFLLGPAVSRFLFLKHESNACCQEIEKSNEHRPQKHG